MNGLEPSSGAPLASPAFTGNPTAPTATAGDSDTTIATTAFVQDAVVSVPQASGQWTWDASPKTALTISLAEREAFTLYIIVHLTTYRVATLSFQSSFLRMICNGRRPAGGGAAVSVAATLNAGTVTTPTISATASGNDINVNIGTGLATNESQVVYYDLSYRLIRKSISY